MNEYVNDFNETVKYYYKELKKYKPLDKEEEKILLAKAKKGDLKAQNKILTSNLKFVFDTAKKFRGFGVSIEDLIAEGNVGMVKAIQKFNTNYDVKFISYAVWWIRQAMKAAINKKIELSKIEKSDDELNNSVVKTSSIRDDEDESVSLREAMMSDEVDSQKREVENNQRVVVDKLLVGLDDREKLIIEEYYGLNGNKEQNLEQIGFKLGLSKERVRQIKKKVLFRMRSEVLCMDSIEIFFR